MIMFRFRSAILLVFCCVMMAPAIHAQTYMLIDTIGPISTHAVHQAIFSPDAKFVAAITEGDADVLIYEADSNKLKTRLKGQAGTVQNIAYSAKGNWIATANANGSVSIFEVKTAKLLKSFYPDSKITATEGLKMNFVGFTAEDKSIVFGGDDGKITEVRNFMKAPQSIYIGESSSPIVCGAVSKDRTLIAWASANLLYVRNQVTSAHKVIAGSSDEITALAFSGDGKMVAVRCKTKVVDIWELKTANKRRSIKAAGQPAGPDYTGLAYSADGRYLITASMDPSPGIWDDDYRLQYQLIGHRRAARCVDFSQDSRMCLSGADDGTIYIWYKAEPMTTTEDMKRYRRDPNRKPDRDTSVMNPDGTGETKVTYTAEKLPTALDGRKVLVNHPVEVHSKNITFYVWDNDQPDGDIISIYFDNKWILSNYRLTAKKKIINAKIEGEGSAYLMLYAHNEGDISPNTAGISIYDGYRETRLDLKSDLKSCDAVKLILK